MNAYLIVTSFTDSGNGLILEIAIILCVSASIVVLGCFFGVRVTSKNSYIFV